MVKKKLTRVLCDTNIFIRYFRGDENVIQRLDVIGFDDLYLSAVSIAEIYSGMRKGEVRKTGSLIKKFNRVDFDKEASQRFTRIMFDYRELNPSIPDAMIAAIAITNQCRLYSLNRKHFAYIKELNLLK
jgi:predicted nucleic acid-binding protein